MFSPINRRDFVRKTLQFGTIAGLGDFAFLHGLRPVSADEAKVSPAKVQFTSEIEPLVRLLEDTPRGKIIETVAGQVRDGMSYEQLLTALMLAGVRSIKPRPVGFKFHAVLVLNSAHLASLAAPDSDRWLPLFWAADNFKASQARNQQEGGWLMPPVEEGKLPPSSQAKKRFMAAMDDWDEEGADRAVTSLVRSAGSGEIIELFWRYGTRDFRDIGHKAIYTANSWRTMQTIGWRHAEPVMRSLAFALLDRGRDGNPAKSDLEADRPWRQNLERVKKIRADWQQGKKTKEAATDLLAAVRTGSHADVCERIVEHLNQGVDAASVWDGIFLGAGELLMRQPGILGIHCITATNALFFGYQNSGNDETRRLLLLQAGAFLPMFRQAMKGRGQLREDLTLDTLEQAEVSASGPAAIEEVFADVSKDRVLAARKTLALLQNKSVKPKDLMTAARRLIFTKGFDSHDYKFSSAALEDFHHATPSCRNRYLAASMFNLHGAGDRDNDLIKRTRAALA